MSDHRLPFKQQSIQSLHQINKHYNEFQHALYTLKIAVEELWRLELEQLPHHTPLLPIVSNTKFDLQVPSIYPCRTILPIATRTLRTKSKIPDTSTSPIIVQPSRTTNTSKTISDRMRVNDKLTQSVHHRHKSVEPFGSISKKQRQYGCGDHSTKYRTKTALLHLKFRCAQHKH